MEAVAVGASLGWGRCVAVGLAPRKARGALLAGRTERIEDAGVGSWGRPLGKDASIPHVAVLTRPAAPAPTPAP